MEKWKSGAPPGPPWGGPGGAPPGPLLGPPEPLDSFTKGKFSIFPFFQVFEQLWPVGGRSVIVIKTNGNRKMEKRGSSGAPLDRTHRLRKRPSSSEDACNDTRVSPVSTTGQLDPGAARNHGQK